MIIGLHDADSQQFKRWNFRIGICMEDVTVKRIGRNIVRERDLILNM